MGLESRRGGRQSQGGTLFVPGTDNASRAPAEYVVRLALVAVRNAVGLVGILFFGWAAPTLVVLAAVVAVPLGIPLVFVLGPSGVTWRQVSANRRVGSSPAGCCALT